MRGIADGRQGCDSGSRRQAALAGVPAAVHRVEHGVPAGHLGSDLAAGDAQLLDRTGQLVAHPTWDADGVHVSCSGPDHRGVRALLHQHRSEGDPVRRADRQLRRVPLCRLQRDAAAVRARSDRSADVPALRWLHGSGHPAGRELHLHPLRADRQQDPRAAQQRRDVPPVLGRKVAASEGAQGCRPTVLQHGRPAATGDAGQLVDLHIPQGDDPWAPGEDRLHADLLGRHEERLQLRLLLHLQQRDR